MEVLIRELKCKRCGHSWTPRSSIVNRCPACHSTHWNKSRSQSITNPTERKALFWIAGETGFELEEIIYQHRRSPDFILPDGRHYEVKRAHGKTRKTVIFCPMQFKTLEQMPDCILLLYDDNNNLELTISFGTFIKSTEELGYKILFNNSR